jgi:hypothetical protein
MSLRALRIALLAALALSAFVPAVSQAKVIVGIGEQNPGMFSDPAYAHLGIKNARIVAAWDQLKYDEDREALDRWIDEAQRTGTQVMISITRSRDDSRKRIAPSVAQYKAQIKAYLKRYPFVKTYIPWNEANHCSQPLCRKPALAAKYFDTIKGLCRSCKVVAADVLDDKNMIQWIKDFKKAAKKKPTIWGIHNYVDANRFETKGTKALIKATKSGEIWFTETGGLVYRKNPSQIKFPGNVPHQAKATKYVFSKLVKLNTRIKRVYLYHWNQPGNPDAGWDSGLVDRFGKPRPAFRVVEAYLGKAKFARQAAKA